mmetsp:Transcript_105096/g.255142  ORF Transcript_105096/g.255142 Transcript_105096/m.255142 type:complete len:292 (+) Transcript_105096:413-1288(+)
MEGRAKNNDEHVKLPQNTNEAKNSAREGCSRKKQTRGRTMQPARHVQHTLKGEKRRRIPAKRPTAKKGTRVLHLKLLAGFAGGGLDGLHEPKSRVLDGLDGIVLRLGDLFVFVLQLLELVLERLLGGLDLGLFLLNRRVQVSRRHVLQLFDLGRLLLVAEVNVCRRARRLETVRKLLQRVVVAAALVVLQRRRIPVLDRREPLDAVRVAQRLPGGRAVHVRDQSAPLAVHLLHDLVPVRLHPFAVASPRREELDEDGLAGRLRVPVVRRQLDGRGGARQGQRHECDRGFHC